MHREICPELVRGAAALEHRRKRAVRNRTPSLGKKVVAKNSAVIPGSLPNLADLITYGEITVGVLRPVGCVATATDGYNSLAMLGRRRGDHLAQLPARVVTA